MRMEVDDMETQLSEHPPQYSQRNLSITNRVLLVVFARFVKVLKVVCIDVRFLLLTLLAVSSSSGHRRLV